MQDDRKRRKHLFAATIVFAGLVLASIPSDACTRCVYLGPEATVIVARSMDWAEDPGTNLYCFPGGMKRRRGRSSYSIAWTSKYGSLICPFMKWEPSMA